MAKHKSNYKSKKSDRFIANVFISFGVVFVVLVASLLIYNGTKKVYAYEDYTSITNWAEMKTQSEDKYVVYYYSQNCGFCNDIKEDVLSFAEGNDAGVKLYLMDGGVMTGTNPFAASSPYRNTPTMHIIVDGEITKSYSGAVEIPAALKSIANGTHADFQ